MTNDITPDSDPMGNIDPMEAIQEASKLNQCTATNRQGKRCGKSAIPGGNVCRMHGGAAPQVQRKARIRLLELIDPAIATLAREMVSADRSGDRQRAANSILDRAGMPRTVATPDSEVAKELLLERLKKYRDDQDKQGEA